MVVQATLLFGMFTAAVYLYSYFVRLSFQVICAFLPSKIITGFILTYLPLYFLDTLRMNQVLSKSFAKLTTY